MITSLNPTLKSLTSTWQARLRAASDKPWLFALLMRQWAHLFRRFARFYLRLLALSHPHKRALKRKLVNTLAGAALFLALGQALPALPPTPIAPYHPIECPASTPPDRATRPIINAGSAQKM